MEPVGIPCAGVRRRLKTGTKLVAQAPPHSRCSQCSPLSAGAKGVYCILAASGERGAVPPKTTASAAPKPPRFPRRIGLSASDPATVRILYQFNTVQESRPEAPTHTKNNNQKKTKPRRRRRPLR